MDQNFQTSFIPKKPIIKKDSISAQPVSFLFVISLLVLFSIILATGGLYFYKGFMAKSITDMQNNLNLAKNRFEPSKIAELQLLDKRLKASTEVLSKHMTVAPIFKALEALTMKSIRYTRFAYDLGEDRKINVKMSGVAVGYRSIALQSDLFTKNKNLIDPIFSNLTVDAVGNVLFDLDFSVDPAFVNYKQTLLTTES